MFFRIRFPGQILTAVMTPVTLGLVSDSKCYLADSQVMSVDCFDHHSVQSYLNGTLGVLTDAQWGWDVAWRRLVCVVIGITPAWIFSYCKWNKCLSSFSAPFILGEARHSAFLHPSDCHVGISLL